MIEPEFDRHRDTQIPRKDKIPYPRTPRPQELGPRKPLPQKTESRTPQIHLAPLLDPVRVMCLALGIALFSVGLIGFVVQDLAQAHLSYWHNMIHVASGVGAIIAGYLSYKASKRFSLGFGSVYAVLGIIGFIVGQRGIPGTGNGTEDSRLWKIIPEVLEFGTADHLIHLAVGALFLLGAYWGVRVPRTAEKAR